MYRAFLIFFMSSLALLASCAPSSESGDQKDEKSQIVASLNKGDNPGALDKINASLAKNPDDVELLYFKAQALSSQTGIDVYSLFPVLKIRLFEVAMTEWQSFQKYKDLSSSAATSSLNPQDQADSLAALDLMIKQLEEIDAETIKFILEEYPYSSYTPRPTACVQYMQVKSDILKDLDKNNVLRGDDALVTQYGEVPIKEHCTDQELKTHEHYNTSMRKRIRSTAVYQVRRRKRDTVRSKTMAGYIQGIYMLFDAIPILKQIPEYKPENLANTSAALDILANIRKRRDKNDHFGKNSRQQITLIASYLLASALKDSLDLPNVTRPADVLCKLRAEVAAEKYSIGIVAGRHLFEVLQDTELFEKNRAQLEKEITVEKLRSEIYSLPEQPTDEIKKKIIRFVHNLQREHC